MDRRAVADWIEELRPWFADEGGLVALAEVSSRGVCLYRGGIRIEAGETASGDACLDVTLADPLPAPLDGMHADIEILFPTPAFGRRIRAERGRIEGNVLRMLTVGAPIESEDWT